MQINHYKSNIHFKSKETYGSESEITDNDNFSECRNSLRNHYYGEQIPYYSIYEKEGRMSEYQFENLLGGLNNIPQNTNYDDILSLPLRNIKKIPDTNNSYRGQTLYSANDKCLETVKNTGITTVIDLVGYTGYDNKIKKSGMDYFEFKVNKVINSPAFDSLRDYQMKQERFFRGMKEDGFDIDIEESLEYTKNKFLSNTREGIEKVTDFINHINNDNFYISCEYGTQETDKALILNNALNPKCQDKPVEAPTKDLVERIFNLYYNMTQEDKDKIGWTKETDDKFMERMADKQFELMHTK